MAGQTKLIKSKIHSVKNVKKITKAMEMVAASKMKKSVSKVLATRPYADRAFELLINLSGERDLSHPLLSYGKKGKILLVIVSANKGLCGSYNISVAKSVAKYIKNHHSDEISVVTVGRYAERLANRLKLSIVASFVDFPDDLKIDEIRGLFKVLEEEFSSGNYHRCFITYTHFISALSRKPIVRQILPISTKGIKNLLEELGGVHEEINIENTMSRYIFEPNGEEVLTEVLSPLVKAVLYEMLLESLASEHSARMVAMKSASENADKLADEFTLSYNRARQEGITREISEIVSGSNS